MKLYAVISLLALSVVALPQAEEPAEPVNPCAAEVAAVPKCGSDCINTIGIEKLGCASETDYACLCTQNAAFYEAGVSACVAAGCTPEEAVLVAPNSAAVCECAGFPQNATATAVPTAPAAPADDGHGGHAH